MADLKPDTPSADHAAMSPYWTKAADLLAGTDAMRAGGAKYLPRFPEEDTISYEYRRKSSKYVNIFGDIVANLAAKPFRKEVAIRDGSASPRMMDLAEDIDGRGNSLHVFTREVFEAGVAYALDWIFIDNTGQGTAETLADERAQGVRPYWVRIPAENMLAVETASIKGREEFVHARWLESSRDRKGFEEKFARRVRIIDRTRNGDGTFGLPHWTLWQEPQEGAQVWDLIASGQLSLGVIPLVPFITGRRKGGWRFIPALQGCADLAVEHYQAESSLKATKELVSFPMLVGEGIAHNPNEVVRVGPRSVLFSPPPGDGRSPGTWKFIEPAATSLRFLADNIKEIEQQLRELGRQPLTAQTGNLTVVTTAFAASKANSVIAAWALNLKDALERALQFTALWMQDPSEPEVVIDADFEVDPTDEKGLDALMAARKAKDISLPTYWSELKRRGVLAPEFDPAAEEEALAAELQGLEPEDEPETEAEPALGQAA